ncbi:hypothetical protein [Solibacillus isronensis]|uniref:hypothetical protein n=1 Tax=Solibacillus isronensis TaxID=412383 RepID=UPI00203F381E|nr:hypothetical protein [Solibacillus isronensis]MCM3721191.1 hypothetical protein [Solibacillus isronensis]
MINKYAMTFRKADVSGPVYEQQITWPLYAWKVYLPEKVTSEIDILQRFVLAVAEVENLQTTNIFIEIGITKDLKETIIQKCEELGYLENNTLTKEGESVLHANHDKSITSMEKLKLMYLFIDAVTGDLVPTFSIDELPIAREMTFHHGLSYDRKNERKPNMFEIEDKLRKANLMRKQMNAIKKVSGVESVTLEELDHEDRNYDELLLEFEGFFEDESVQLEDEVAIETINVSHLGIDDVLNELDGEQQLDGSFGHSEELSQQQKGVQANQPTLHNRTLKFRTDKPELIYVPVTIYGHADTFLNKKISVKSPFSENEDLWFNSKFVFIQSNDDALQQFVEKMRDEMYEQFKARYAFSNTMNIQLLTDFPLIANDAKWKKLRNEIESAEIAYLRIQNGDKDYDNYYMRVQRTLELAFYLVFERLSVSPILKTVRRENYAATLDKISNELSIAIPKNYYNFNTFERVSRSAKSKISFSSSKDAIMLYALNAYFSKDIVLIEVLRQLPNVFSEISAIVDARNNGAHYSTKAIDHEATYTQVRQSSIEILQTLISHILLRNERT